MRRLLVSFGAGAVGGLVNSLAVWSFGHYGITKMLGVSLAPPWSPPWLYPRIVWGGLWGLAFILPFMKSRVIAKGLVLSIFPTLVQLFVVFPFQAHKGVLGIDLGLLTPVFVLFFNAIWGLAAGLAIKASK